MSDRLTRLTREMFTPTPSPPRPSLNVSMPIPVLQPGPQANLQPPKDISKLISIVMPAYNQAKYIYEAISSILNQTYKNIELIIINDGSTDNTQEIIDSFKDQRIKTKRLKQNGGTGQALNEGFRLATGAYETWFSSDSIMYPGCLEALARTLDSKPEGFVYGKSDIISSEGKPMGPIDVKPFDREYLLQTCYLGIAYMWKKDLRIKAGEFYAEAFSEDFDMHLKMSEIANFIHVPETLAAWRSHPENLTHTTTLPGGWKDHHRFVREAVQRRSKPFFTILLVTMDRPEFLKEALDSIHNQTFKNYEVLIVSKSKNHIEDKNIVASFANQKFYWLEPSKYPIYIVRNQMIKKAAGRYTTILDDDDRLPERALEDRYEFILKHHAPDFIYSDYRVFKSDRDWRIYQAERLTADYILTHRGTSQKMIGANLTIWTPVLKKMKYDDALLPENAADCELAIRLLKENLRYEVLNKVTYEYRNHPGQVSAIINPNQREVMELWNRIIKKHSQVLGTKEYWEKKAREGYFEKFDKPALDHTKTEGFPYIKAALESKDRTAKILEIGPGGGKTTNCLVALSDHVFVTGISKATLEIVKKRFPQIIASETDGEKLPYTDNEFDFVISAYVFQHNTIETIKKLLIESNRVLKPDGMALIEFLGKREGYELREKEHIKGAISIALEFKELLDVIETLGIEWYQIHAKKQYQYNPGFINFWLEFKKSRIKWPKYPS